MKSIHLWGVRQNNLKNIDVEIPLGSFTVVCGPSGSGKSSLAFQTLYAEGQRRYIESLSSYARQFLGKAPKPELDGITNIPPAIAIEQKNSIKTSRSTVGTATEVIDYLRLLYEKISLPVCPTYGFTISKDSPSDVAQRALKELQGDRGYILAAIEPGSRRLNGKALLELMKQEGYLRILIPSSIPSSSLSSAAMSSAINSSKNTQKKTKKKASKKSSSKKEPAASYELAVGSMPQCVAPQTQTELGEVYEIQPEDSEEILPENQFYLVIDRIVFNDDNSSRMIDSISQAYSASIKFNIGVQSGRVSIITTKGRLLRFSQDRTCTQCGFSFPIPSSALFSFNSPIGACPECNGFGNTLTLDEKKVIPDPTLSLAGGALHPFTMPSASSDRKQLASYCKSAGIDMKIPWYRLPKTVREKIWNGDGKFYGVIGLFEYLETKKYKMHVRVFLARYKSPKPCLSCHGTRLRPESGLYLVGGKKITDLAAMTVGELLAFINNLELSPMQLEIAGEVFRQLKSRLQFLSDVGVEYLTINRAARTLSGGEFQRLSLAKQLGMGLSQTLYVLDEPTVGLHPRDNDRLIQILKKLNRLGNTLVVVEHDRDVITNSDYIIETGPGSGHLGGNIVFAGATKAFLESGDSVTVPYLVAGRASREAPTGNLKSNRQRDPNKKQDFIEITGAYGHNLKNVNVKFPLESLVTVTGVSGSGKSSLVSQTLYPIVARHLRHEFLEALPYQKATGLDKVGNVLYIDQSPIGKTARSTPVTYLKVFDAIRTLMASLPESKLRGYTAGTYSLNVDGGRCPVCRGLGVEVIDMMFMDDVALVCDACDGKKYRRELLEVRYNGKNIHEILDLTVDEAIEFFIVFPHIRKPLTFLHEVGLGYIRLGQSASTLSGGESQRLKIAREFITTTQKGTLYLLDEPTTGLHFREIEMLMKILHQLVRSGGSVILIEHNLEVIRESDWIIDMGPEPGELGGTIVAAGPPAEIINTPESLTGQYLKKSFATIGQTKEGNNESHL